MTNNQPQPEDTILPCVQFINALCATSHSVATQFQNILNSANGAEPSSSPSTSPSPAAAASTSTSTSVLCAPIQPDPAMDSRALDYLDEMRDAGAVDYTDYSRLFDLIQDELKCPEVIPQAPLTAALLRNLSAEHRYTLSLEGEFWKPKARVIGVYWEPERGTVIHLSALTWVTLVTTLQVLDPDSGVCWEELAEEYGEVHIVGVCKVQLMEGLKEEVYRGTLNWDGIEIFCVLTPKEVEQWNLEVAD